MNVLGLRRALGNNLHHGSGEVSFLYSTYDLLKNFLEIHPPPCNSKHISKHLNIKYIMNGDLLGDMAFPAPASENNTDSPSEVSQERPPAPAIMSFDSLSGSPIKAKESHPSNANAPPDNLLDLPASSSTLSSDSDNPHHPLQLQQQPQPSGTSGDLPHFPSSAPTAHPFSVAKPFSEEPPTNSDPFSASRPAADQFAKPEAAESNATTTSNATSNDSTDLLGAFAPLQSQTPLVTETLSVEEPNLLGEPAENTQSANQPPPDNAIAMQVVAPSPPPVPLEMEDLGEKKLSDEEVLIESLEEKNDNVQSNDDDGIADNGEKVTGDASVIDQPMTQPVESNLQSSKLFNVEAVVVESKNAIGVEAISDDESADQAQPIPLESQQVTENTSGEKQSPAVEATPSSPVFIDEEKKVEQSIDEESPENDMVKAEGTAIPTTTGQETDKPFSIEQVEQQTPSTEDVETKVESANSNDQPAPTEAKEEDDDDGFGAYENGKEADVPIGDMPSTKAAGALMENMMDTLTQKAVSDSGGPADEQRVINEAPSLKTPPAPESEPEQPSASPPTTSEIVSTQAGQASRVKPKGNGALTKQLSAVTTEERSISTAATPKEQSLSSAPTEIPEDEDSQIEEATYQAARGASEPSLSPDTSNTDSQEDELETSNPPLAPENSSQQTEYAQYIELLEKELHAARGTITQLQEKEEESQLKDEVMDDLQKKLQMEMGKRAEAEDASRLAKEKAEKVMKQFSTLKQKSTERIGQMKAGIDILMTSEKKMQDEMVDIREERDEQTRRLNSYTTRLNEAKKNEAVKVNTADHYENKVDDLNDQVKECKEQMAQLKFERDRYKKELGNWKKYADQRTNQLEGQLKHEKKLNDERKRKMKVFVEAKTEETRSTKADNVSLQAELDQTTLSLKDFNQRYQQIHSQWVQSQTRNRELQRDMTKQKNDSEKMSKVGGNLEAKLSRSANEIEDHKNKRLTAKNELMTVIAQLEEEKKANSRLREYVKSTFTPKVLSQQQSLREDLDNFEAGLKKLAIRFGRELPSPRKKNGQPNKDSEVAAKMSTMEEIQSKISNANAVRVLANLEEETQRVNEHIANVSTNVDRLQALLVAPTTKGCVGAMFNF
jgi:hypothetical protein